MAQWKSEIEIKFIKKNIKVLAWTIYPKSRFWWKIFTTLESTQCYLKTKFE